MDKGGKGPSVRAIRAACKREERTMKPKLLAILAGLLVLTFAAPVHQAQAAVSVGVSVATGGPHRGLSLSFSSRPSFVRIPSSQVYYSSNADCDVYRSGNDWYYTDDQSWYRGQSYGGPFVEVSVEPGRRQLEPWQWRRERSGAISWP